jgi:RNA polymerase sigma-70 factor (ECF subfamily)
MPIRPTSKEDTMAPAGRIEVAGEPAAVSLVVADGRVTRVYLIRNPRKLTRLDEPADLAR